MTMRPIIFISAASRELRSARQLVANTLEILGYDRDWEDIFGAEQGDLREMLRRRIDASAGVVQLVGQCYGAEPRTPDEQFGRVSYTQYEALYAKQRGKKVWYLILDPDFTADPHDPESEELSALQTTYREKVREGAQLYHPLGSSDALEAKVLKLRDDLGKLRRRGKLWALGVLALLLVIFAMVAALNKKIDKILAQGIAQYPQAEAKARESEGGKQDQIEERTYEELAKSLGIDAGTLREKLPQFAKELKSSPDATAYKRATAAYIAKSYAEAERLAVDAADQAQKALPPQIAETIRALELAGWSAEHQIKYARAVGHFRAAAALTDRERDPLEWVRIQYSAALAMHKDGDYSTAETMLRVIIRLTEELLGPEHEFTLGSRLSLASALSGQGKYAEAEAENRSLLTVQEEVNGPDDRDTLTIHNNLGLALYFQGKCAEAEQEERYVFEKAMRILGPKNRLTLFSQNNLAMALDCQRKHAEAEKEFRASLAAKDQVLGPEEPNTLYTCYYLALCLQKQGKLGEAKHYAKRAADGALKVLGLEHPETKKYAKLSQQLP